MKNLCLCHAATLHLSRMHCSQLWWQAFLSACERRPDARACSHRKELLKTAKLGRWSVSKQVKIHRYTCFKANRSAQSQNSSQLLDSSATSLKRILLKNIRLI